MQVVVLVHRTGTMVLPYHYTYDIYAVRGGPSHYGAYCGAFSVALSVGPGTANWFIGAALSFKPICINFNKLLLVDSIYSFILI